MNQALLSKSIWKLGEEKEKLWARIIIERYGIDKAGWYTVKKLSTHGSSVWRAIMGCSQFIKENVTFKVGRGDMIQFWKDRWCTIQPLEVEFPKIFALSRNKEAFISQMGSRIGNEFAWDFQLRRNLYDWELQSMGKILAVIDTIKIRDENSRM
ncbi:hypothetical protein ACHQM5_013694 [Ranunculus cassubicifolius]